MLLDWSILLFKAVGPLVGMHVHTMMVILSSPGIAGHTESAAWSFSSHDESLILPSHGERCQVWAMKQLPAFTMVLCVPLLLPHVSYVKSFARVRNFCDTSLLYIWGFILTRPRPHQSSNRDHHSLLVCYCPTTGRRISIFASNVMQLLPFNSFYLKTSILTNTLSIDQYNHWDGYQNYWDEAKEWICQAKTQRPVHRKAGEWNQSSHNGAPHCVGGKGWSSVYGEGVEEVSLYRYLEQHYQLGRYSWVRSAIGEWRLQCGGDKPSTMEIRKLRSKKWDGHSQSKPLPLRQWMKSQGSELARKHASQLYIYTWRAR